MANKKKIEKSNWTSNFILIGEAKVNDYTFKTDEKSEKSSWIYSSMNLGVDCGEKYGCIYPELFGGYSDENPGVIYAHGKDEDGRDDFSSQIQVDWGDRFDESILDTVGDMCFITVGLEKTDKGKTFYKKFLSAYDAIAYIKEHIEDGMAVCVRGNLKYDMYNDTVRVHKNITSIALSSKKPEEYSARFTQTILIDKDSVDLKSADKDRGIIYIDAIVLDYMKEYNGVEIKGQFPYKKQFEFKMDFGNEKVSKKVINFLKVKKDYTQITLDGYFVEGGATVLPTMDDVPEEIKSLIDCGFYTEEEVLKLCADNGNKEYHMVFYKPVVKKIGDDKISTIMKFDEKYTEDDLSLDYLFEESDNEKDGSSSEVDESMSWLDELD